MKVTYHSYGYHEVVPPQITRNAHSDPETDECRDQGAYDKYEAKRDEPPSTIMVAIRRKDVSFRLHIEDLGCPVLAFKSLSQSQYICFYPKVSNFARGKQVYYVLDPYQTRSICGYCLRLLAYQVITMTTVKVIFAIAGWDARILV